MTLFADRRIHEGKGERRVTWLELFFDLVTVVAISRLGIQLHSDHSLTGLLSFTGLLVVVWWIWISYSYLADIFDNDSIPDRLVQLFAMVGMAVVAVALPGSEAASTTVFAAANAGLFAFLAIVYFFSGLSEPRARELSHWYVAGSATGAALWGVSLLVDAPAQYYVWGVAVLANAIISGPLAYARMRHAPQQVSHMPERFGLFLLIVLGEAILATINGIAQVQLDGTGVAIGLTGFVIAAAIWWIYFDHFDSALITKAIQQGPGAQVRSFVYGYGHLLIYAAIVALGVGVELAIEHASGHASVSEPLLGIGIIGVMVGFVLTSIGTRQRLKRLPLVLKLSILIAALGCTILSVRALITCLLLALLFLALIIVEMGSLRRGSFSGTPL